MRRCLGMIAFVLVASPLLAASPAAAPAGKWMSLFDGQSLAGWQVRCLPADAGKVFWSVRDGAIECDSLGRKEHDYVWLMHEGEWGDFELELEFQAFRSSPGNTGVQIRSRYDASATAPKGGWLDGPQIDLHPPAPFRTGLIYDETRTEKRWIFPSRPSSKLDPLPLPPGFTFRYAEDGGGWNHLRLVARGTKIQTVLNGVTMADFDGRGILDNEEHRRLNVGLRGQVALQLHVRDELKVRFRALRLRELP
ncbi:MAG: DUF1080 domain-containing protein [Verrucomicrobia bacterium]|nr:DUF1080 domain-containing protein [Verrucomicrobiota bacterium]